MRCPGCGQDVEPVPVLYGYPTPEAFEAADRGELAIGGCCPDFGPDAVCPVCGEGVDAPPEPVKLDRRSVD